MTAPFFSVWISTRNAGRWVGRCLDSLFSQSFTDWHAVFIDDASTDDTWARVSEVDWGPHLTLLRNTTRVRQVGAYLQALPLLSGQVIVELDGDDWFSTPDALVQIKSCYDSGADATAGQSGAGATPVIPRSRWFDRLDHSYAPRTWKRSLALDVLRLYPSAYLDSSGHPWQSAGDVALWAPICVLADTIRSTPHPVYHVNMENEESDWRKEGGLQRTCAEAIRTRWQEVMK